VASVIIADDDEDVLLLMAETMRNAGFHVTTAPDGAALLARVAIDRFDAVVTDMRMPYADGLAVIDGVRRVDARIPVIVITGYSDHDEGTLRARGAAACLRKPLLHLRDLPAAVKRALAARAA
jgi:two-component system, NtrC family, response regulator GlrR